MNQNEANRELDAEYESAIGLIREYAPPHLQQDFISRLRPAIGMAAIKTEEEQLRLGASKFFGSPDVPDDFEWPCMKGHPLPFVAQFNLVDASAFDAEKALPGEGVLSFFFDYDCHGRVFWWPSVQKRLSMPEPQSDWLTKISSALSLQPKPNPVCSLRFFPAWTLPDWDAPNAMQLTDDEFETLEPFLEEFPRGGHRLLGFAASVQNSVEFYAAQQAGQFHWKKDAEILEQSAKEWRLLFQMDSQMPDWSWGDVGMLYFMIRHSDLAARNFTGVQLVFQNH